MHRFVLALCLAPTALFAQCPEPDRSAQEAALLQTLKSSPDEVAGERAAREVWEHWLVAPNAQAQALLDQGMERRNAYDFEESERFRLNIEQFSQNLEYYCQNINDFG